MEAEFLTADTALPPCLPLPWAMLGLPVSSTAKVMYARLLDAALAAGAEDANGILHPRWQLPPCTPKPCGGRRRARKARPPVRRPRPAGGLVLRAQPAKPPPPRPRASTCVGGGAYPKSHRLKAPPPPKRKKVANCHFFAMRYP